MGRYPILLLAILSTVVVILAAGLRPDSFFAGDPGVKLIAARAVLSNPSRPFNVPLPRIGADSVPHVEPFFAVHGDHAHAVTSPIFPVLSAPFLAAFGLRGLYVLPAAGFLLAVVGCAAVATAGGMRRSGMLTGATAVLATPLLFYGLEFWEHMPAVACAALAVALFLNGRPFWSGLLLGCAALLRPEALWFGVAVLGASRWLPRPPDLKTCGLAIVGTLLAVGPYEIYVLIHFGTLVPPHLAANAGEMGRAWLSGRGALLSTWFGLARNGSFWSAAPVVVGAIVALGLTRRPKDHAFLWTLAVVDVLLTLLTAPNDGGSQWGARYLLFAYIPLTAIAADMVDQVSRRRVATGIALVLAVAGCLWIQRSAYRQLRGTKATYGRVVDFMASETAESGHIVTDVWWLDQIAASAIGGRQVLYAPDGDTARAIVHRLSDATVPVVTVVRSASESPDTSAWNAGTCYFEERRDTISTRDLVLVQLRHRCQQ